MVVVSSSNDPTSAKRHNHGAVPELSPASS
jgi:hypothetical protein